MPPTANASRGLASTFPRPWPIAPIAHWSARRSSRGVASHETPRHPEEPRSGVSKDGPRGSAILRGSLRSHLRMTQRSPVLVHRLALFDERGHALGTIFQRERRVEQIAFDVHAFR